MAVTNDVIDKLRVSPSTGCGGGGGGASSVYSRVPVAERCLLIYLHTIHHSHARTVFFNTPGSARPQDSWPGFPSVPCLVSLRGGGGLGCYVGEFHGYNTISLLLIGSLGHLGLGPSCSAGKWVGGNSFDRRSTSFSAVDHATPPRPVVAVGWRAHHAVPKTGAPADGAQHHRSTQTSAAAKT